MPLLYVAIIAPPLRSLRSPLPFARPTETAHV